MALMKDGLWGIVNDTESAPDEANAERHGKYISRRDRALALIVLSVEPSLLYQSVEATFGYISKENLG